MNRMSRVCRGVLMLALATLPALATEEKKAPEMSKEMEAMMAAYMAAATPGDAHKGLADMAGTWTVDVTSFWDPSAPPQKSTGTAVRSMIMDGRYLQESVEATMDGQPFKGMGLTGYDNVSGKYVGSWVDSMGTGIMTSEGTWDKKTGTGEFMGKHMDPITKAEKTTKMTSKLEGKDKESVDFFEPDGKGGWTKTMTIVYTRKK